jgi:hypothetical protein
MTNRTIPLKRRPIDVAILGFFLVNILFITYIVDAEQLIIPDASHFTYPLWPPRVAVDLIHWYGRTFDPVLIARPVWWKMTIVIDDVLFGPFYVVAIYAFTKGKNWIRIPSFWYSAMMFTNVAIILGEERFGTYATPLFPLVLMLNLPWLLFPLIITARMAWSSEPFSEKFAAPDAPTAAVPHRTMEAH